MKINVACRTGLPRQAVDISTIRHSCGIHSLPPDAKASILNKVRDFKTFNEDNGEHDFGAFKHAGERICWKIDYYAPDMQHGSEAPADLSKIVRMLTILLASEW